jgi:hypothetical protein
VKWPDFVNYPLPETKAEEGSREFMCGLFTGRTLRARRGLYLMRLLLLCERISPPMALCDSCGMKTFLCQVILPGSAFHH